MPLTTEIILHFHFHFKVFPEKERERVRARGEDRAPVSPTISGELRAPVRADLASSSPMTAIDASRDRASEITISDRNRRRGCWTGAHEALRRRTQSSVNR